MNILLDAFYDLNYGDDLFVETITGLFPKCKFYSFLEYYPPKVVEKAQGIKNLYLLPECPTFLQKNMFDAYLCVGGDVFPDRGDYTKRKAYVRSVKECGGTVAFWGFSLFHDYCDQTKKDLVELMAGADIVAPRDERSAALLRELMPGKEVSAIADLAFLSEWKQKRGAGEILGISVRQPNYATDREMDAYIAKLRDAVCAYLAENDSRRVKLFSLSSGNTSDEAVTQKILDGVKEADRVEHILYTGDTSFIKEEIAQCTVMICTRLHAMISCIAMKVPFLPVVYEVKMDHILEQIGYKGPVIRFRDMEHAVIRPDELGEDLWDRAAESRYLGHTEEMLKKLRRLLGYECLGAEISKGDLSGPVCPDKQALITTYQTALNQRNIDVQTLENAMAAMAAELQAIKATWQYRATQKVNRMLHRP